MAEPSPARFFATLIGTLLVVIGILGFFGLFGNDAWLDALHMATGALGLAMASQAPRAFAKWAGLGYLALAAWGFAAGDAAVLHLVVGLLGIGAAAATAPRPATA